MHQEILKGDGPVLLWASRWKREVHDAVLISKIGLQCTCPQLRVTMGSSPHDGASANNDDDLSLISLFLRERDSLRRRRIIERRRIKIDVKSCEILQILHAADDMSHDRERGDAQRKRDKEEAYGVRASGHGRNVGDPSHVASPRSSATSASCSRSGAPRISRFIGPLA